MHPRRLPAMALVGMVLVVSPLWAEKTSGPKASLGLGVEPTAPNAAHPGILVRQVAPDGPAAKAGLEKGDVIVKVADKDLKDFEGLLNILANHKPGDHLAFHVFRNGQEKTVQVTLGERKAAHGGGISVP